MPPQSANVPNDIKPSLDPLLFKRGQQVDTGALEKICNVLQGGLTFQFQADEVGVAQVLQKYAVWRRRLEVKGDVSTGLPLESGEVQGITVTLKSEPNPRVLLQHEGRGFEPQQNWTRPSTP
ncbi:hypothetical protein AGIG_G4586 [Arapaima gigas]